MGLPNPSRHTKYSGANGDRGKKYFAVQLTTSRHNGEELYVRSTACEEAKDLVTHLEPRYNTAVICWPGGVWTCYIAICLFA